jgi:hypothetical protein
VNASEISRRGYQALIQELGYGGAGRFLLRFESGSSDYIKERHQWLDPLKMDDFRNYIQQKPKQK